MYVFIHFSSIYQGLFCSSVAYNDKKQTVTRERKNILEQFTKESSFNISLFYSIKTVVSHIS